MALTIEPPDVLVTPRLTLRPPLEVDLDAVARGLDDYEVARWLGTVPHPYTRADASHWFDNMEQGEGDRRWTIHDARGFVGAVVVRGRRPERRMDGAPTGDHILGYWLVRHAWGRGLMTEAVAAVLGEHFERSGADVIASAHARNAASLRIQEKMGFERIGTGEEHSLASGTVRPTVRNRLRRAEFERRFPRARAAA